MFSIDYIIGLDYTTILADDEMYVWYPVNQVKVSA